VLCIQENRYFVRPLFQLRKLALLLAWPVVVSGTPQQAVNQDAVRLQEFETSVQSYMKLRDKAKPQEAAKPSSSADKLAKEKH